MEKEDWIKKYGYSMMLYIDGYPMRTNWDARPVFVPGMSEADFQTVIADYSKWTNTQEEDENGNLVNSYLNYLYPIPGAMSSDQEMGEINDYIRDKKIDMSSATTMRSIATSKGNYPDYQGLTIPKGRHTIKIQSLGGQWHFDDMKLVARKKTWDTPTSLEIVNTDNELKVGDENAPVEFYNLQGVRVENPQGGIFIRRQGSKVSKVAIR